MAGRGPSSQRLRENCWAFAPVGALVLLTALIAGCGGSDVTTADPATTTTTTPSTGLSVTVDPAQVAPGDRTQAVVVNKTGREYTYGAGYELEQQIDGTWSKVALPPTPIPDIGYVAPAGENGPPVTVDVPADAQAGTWRVVIDRGAPGGLLSGEFAVTGG